MTSGEPTGGGPSLRDWVAVSGAVIGAFMAILDVQITNASLRDIQGGLAASLDEGSWITTSYLVAEIIAIPLTGWLCRIFSMRIYVVVGCGLFLVFSALCGTATSLFEMILYRTAQGFTGGGLIPIAMSLIPRRLPPSSQPVGLAMFGLAASLAPVAGPALGGWLTDTWSWKWVFYVNVAPGLVLMAALWYALDEEATHLGEIAHGDWFGILFMAAGIGCLTAVLEEGERKDWFTADWIRYCTVIACITLPIFIAIELWTKRPFINLRLFTRRATCVASLLGASMGFALYGSTYLMPVYLTQVQAFSAFQIGQVMMWAGLPQLLVIPFVPRLMRLVDARLLVAAGFLLFATSCLINGYITHETGEPQLRLPQVIRAVGQSFIIVPLSGLAIGGLEGPAQADGSSLFNALRNFGGSIGISMLSTFATIREHYHFDVISSRLTIDNPLVFAWLGNMAGHMSSFSLVDPPAMQQALGKLQLLVRREAYTLTYADCFFGMGVILICSITMLLLLPRPKAVSGAGH